MNQADLILKVKDLWTTNNWGLSKLSFILPTEIRNKILSINLTTINNTRDIPTWALTSNGIFSTNSTYKLLFAPPANTYKFH